jgi:hypothetical protein
MGNHRSLKSFSHQYYCGDNFFVCIHTFEKKYFCSNFLLSICGEGVHYYVQSYMVIMSTHGT